MRRGIREICRGAITAEVTMGGWGPETKQWKERATIQNRKINSWQYPDLRLAGANIFIFSPAVKF
jgi:hypothetical protein